MDRRMTRGPHLITSLTNDRVKAIRALDMRKERKETGLFVAEGASILMTARQHGFEPATLVFQTNAEHTAVHRDLIAAALDRGSDVLEVTEAVMSKLASKENPQSLLGVFSQVWSKAPSPQLLKADACWLALEEIRDPGNLGTIIRTADAVGASGIMLIGNCCDAYARETVRATMGSVFAVPLVRMSREDFLSWRSGWTGDVVGTHLTAKADFRTAQLRSPTLLIMGSEGPGLSDSLTRSCTKLVKIPMAGDLDSLNLAVATALSLYQIRGPHLKL
jgi:RNA methyltransferase, TrmH family